MIKNYKKWNTDEINVVRKSINTILSYMIKGVDFLIFLDYNIKGNQSY